MQSASRDHERHANHVTRGGGRPYVVHVGRASCLLRIRGNALALESIARELDLQKAHFRGDLRRPPDWDGVTRNMVWDAVWETWEVPQPRVHRLGNPTADAVGRLLDHLEPRRDALARVLATPDALGEVYVYYTRVREVMSVLPATLHARLAAFGLATRVELTDAFG